MLRNFSEVILLCCLFLGSLFSWPAIAGEEKSVETARDCKVAREFITKVVRDPQADSYGLLKYSIA
jgi:hypothetical protein